MQNFFPILQMVSSRFLARLVVNTGSWFMSGSHKRASPVYSVLQVYYVFLVDQCTARVFSVQWYIPGNVVPMAQLNTVDISPWFIEQD